MDALRIAGPALLAVATTLWIDALTARRGLQPPGFRPGPSSHAADWSGPLLRRSLALATLAVILWLAVFGPLGTLGTDLEPDLSAMSPARLFLLHGLLVVALAVWWLLGYAGESHRPGADWTDQLGFETPRLGRELAIGLVVGLASWFVVIAVMIAVGLLTLEVGGEEALPSEPPPMIVWIAGLPWLVRLAVAVSAGLVEEAFFRGFLQPRAGVALSSVLFVLAHLSYDQPLMLVGVALLSLLYALLVVWRQNVWAAVTAHFVFDAVQLLIVVPTALRLMPAGREGGAGAPLGALMGSVADLVHSATGAPL